MKSKKRRIWEMIEVMCQRKNWKMDESKYKEWGTYLLRIDIGIEIMEKAFDEFSTDPQAREIGHLIAKINGIVSREQMEEPVSLKDYRHKGRGPNLAPEIMDIIDAEPPEKWHKMIALSKRMIEEGPESARTEWHNTLRYAEGRL